MQIWWQLLKKLNVFNLIYHSPVFVHVYKDTFSISIHCKVAFPMGHILSFYSLIFTK